MNSSGYTGDGRPAWACGAIPALALLAQVAGAFAGGPGDDELRDAGRSTDWILPNHSYDSRRHVDLSQIDRDNAARLSPVCRLELGDTNRFGAGPLVYHGVMYVTSGDATIALDAATCVLRWRHDWSASGRGQPGTAVTNAFKSRGGALKDGRLVRATSGGALIALDAASGRAIWEQPVTNPARYELVTMAPLVFEDLVIVGIGIGEFGIKGWIGAFRLSDGSPAWRFNTVPDEGEPGAETWGEGAARQRGGGAVWTTPALDPASGRMYVPVGNPVPDFHGRSRPGANLYTGSLLVLDVRTGKLLGYRQFVPHDVHDWDLTVAGPLYDGAGAAGGRPMIAVGGKDGLLRGLDRATRELVFEAPVTTRRNVDAPPTTAGVGACPGVLGGMQWSLPAFNPALHLLFAPAVDWCGQYRMAESPRLVPGQLYMGGAFNFDPGDQGRGWLTAVDASSGEARWKYESRRPMLAAVTTTSSGLVFTGELTGDFLVLDGRDGRVLYRHDTGIPLHAGVITYAVDGKQYIAIASGAATAFWRASSAPSTVVVYALPR